MLYPAKCCPDINAEIHKYKNNKQKTNEQKTNTRHKIVGNPSFSFLKDFY